MSAGLAVMVTFIMVTFIMVIVITVMLPIMVFVVVMVVVVIVIILIITMVMVAISDGRSVMQHLLLEGGDLPLQQLLQRGRVRSGRVLRLTTHTVLKHLGCGYGVQPVTMCTSDLRCKQILFYPVWWCCV